MERWTHYICDACWFEREPNRDPVRVVRLEYTGVLCCYCNREQWKGIMVREDPESDRLRCGSRKRAGIPDRM